VKEKTIEHCYDNGIHGRFDLYQIVMIKMINTYYAKYFHYIPEGYEKEGRINE